MKTKRKNMELYSIDIAKICKAEIVGMIKRYNLPHTVDELYRLKMEGYNKLVFEKSTNKLLFYTLNSSKTTYELSSYAKNMVNGLVALGFEKQVPEPALVQNEPATKDEALTEEQIYKEIDRITKMINLFGYNKLDSKDAEFYEKHSDYI